jgi:hypothetical protein
VWLALMLGVGGCRDEKWVILTSHHVAESLTDGSDFGRAPGEVNILLTPESSLAGTVVAGLQVPHSPCRSVNRSPG